MKLRLTFLLAAAGLVLFTCEAPNTNGVSSDAAAALETTRSKML